MKNVKVKVSDLIGVALDWAVAKCMGLPVVVDTPKDQEERLFSSLPADEMQTLRPALKTKVSLQDANGFRIRLVPEYSTDWAQGGPIIDREKINLSVAGAESWMAVDSNPALRNRKYDKSPLVAAMRCFVAVKLDADEIEVPGELAELMEVCHEQ